VLARATNRDHETANYNSGALEWNVGRLLCRVAPSFFRRDPPRALLV